MCSRPPSGGNSDHDGIQRAIGDNAFLHLQRATRRLRASWPICKRCRAFPGTGNLKFRLRATQPLPARISRRRSPADRSTSISRTGTAAAQLLSVFSGGASDFRQCRPAWVTCPSPSRLTTIRGISLDSNVKSLTTPSESPPSVLAKSPSPPAGTRSIFASPTDGGGAGATAVKMAMAGPASFSRLDSRTRAPAARWLRLPCR